MNKNYRNIGALMALTGLLFSGTAFSQEKAVTDTIKAKRANEELKSDRNVMLNAAKNNEPREVNIGLPASVGGTTVMENGLPVVYYYWPELPTKTWRQDAMINKVQLFDLGQTAIKVGDVGFSLGTFDNLGTDKFKGVGRLNSNHFGLLRGDINLSGPLNKKGLKFSAGAYLNFDPGTFDAKGLPEYYSDKTQMYKGALTQDYSFQGGKGSITAMYKYFNTEGLRNFYAPFIYKEGGKIEEIEGFKMGGDSYFESTGKLMVKDAFTGKYENRDVVKDNGTESHTLDIIWKNILDNGLHLNMVSRYHSSMVGCYLPLMTGINTVGDSKYTYADTGEAYTGNSVQAVLAISGKKRPAKTFMSQFEVGKKSNNHNWNIGLNLWNYSIDKYAAEGVKYFQEVAANPRKLIKAGSDINEYGNMFGGLDYHDGSESKISLFMTDKWDMADVFTLSLGARLEYQNLRGNFLDRNLKQNDIHGPKTDIKKDWLNKAFMLNAVYKMTNTFGLLGEVNYNEQGGNLDNYTVGEEPNIKQSRIPGASFGVYFNHPMVSLVSKATFIQRDEYRTALTFSNPNNAADDVKRDITNYEIQTLGWTTDVLLSPCKGFNLHFLVTVQAPKYKDFSGKVSFNDGSIVGYDFSDKTVTGVSKVLLEIDPSYTWQNLRIWASARYFSKQYLNKPNTLPLEGRWETFAGANYKLNKFLDFNVTVVNLLNQRGASGSIPGGDLITTTEAAQSKYNTVMSGSYIRPFTVEFGVKYNF
ncbi:hypothetical protein JGH11_15900 [Dysgonomonas sp. Marseille-P4677]|uniref:hypothetical protein n=1 Tax=Dysgonomonas sp. Marseille-P4677 TaxID=2364790 RepID=UPI0019132FE1|nr:hypothetical protein [Dysgonomonas sp. Marseille-P4677]MBK5722359.1 hypothetical protein [Dysgonomonas sp. Marseille-P4677]